jgi:hypothetical protein
MPGSVCSYAGTVALCWQCGLVFLGAELGQHCNSFHGEGRGVYGSCVLVMIRNQCLRLQTQQHQWPSGSYVTWNNVWV